MMRRFPVSVLALLLAAACAPAAEDAAPAGGAPEPGAVDAGGAGAAGSTAVDGGEIDDAEFDVETVIAHDPAQVADGKAIAMRECATCHALPDVSASPNPQAPPLTELLMRYDQDVLANDLIEGVRLGHDAMPLFDFNVIAADALVAYLRSIRPPPGSAEE